MAKTFTVGLYLSNKLYINISTQKLPLRVVLHKNLNSETTSTVVLPPRNYLFK
jgi:hypothetical protein